MKNSKQDTVLTLSTNWNRIRNMCIRLELYHSGDCRAYEQLMYYVRDCEVQMTEEQLKHIVIDIVNHTDYKELGYCDYQECCKNVEYHILNDCTYITSNIEY